MFPTDLTLPGAILLASGAFYILAARRAARPADPLRPRMAPWRLISIGAGFVAFACLVYLISRGAQIALSTP